MREGEERRKREAERERETTSMSDAGPGLYTVFEYSGILNLLRKFSLSLLHKKSLCYSLDDTAILCTTE